MEETLITRSFSEKAIECEIPHLMQFFEYAAIAKAYRYKDCYYLFTDSRTVMIIPERCFTEGDPAAFQAFLEEKTGKQVKVIR